MMKAELKNVVQARIPTQYGDFMLHYFSYNLDDKEHLALVKGEVSGRDHVPIRIHSECLTGDVFGSLRCDCGEQLNLAMKLINDQSFGVLIYLRQEGRGIGLLKKLQAYNLQDEGMDTVEANVHLGHLADEREYDVAALILQNLQVSSVDLMTNNPKKMDGLRALGIDVKARIAIELPVHAENEVYLKTKADKMAHWLLGKK